MKIAVMGSGGWGTALALVLLENGHEVTLWSYREEESAILREKRENPMLKGVPLPDGLALTSDRECVKNCKVVVLATPSFAVRTTARAVASLLEPSAVLVSVSKGIEKDTSLTLTDAIAQEVGEGHPIVALSGPSHAEEVGRGVPTVVVSASRDKAAAELASWMKTSLGDKVKEVKITHRLVSSPAIVTDSNNAGYRRMVKMMQAARGDIKGIMPLEPLVLEVNPHHDLLVRLNEMKTAKPLLAQCVTEQLYDDCLVSAGLMDDSRTMIPRLNSLLLAALGGDFKIPSEVVSIKADDKKETVVEEKKEAPAEEKKN